MEDRANFGALLRSCRDAAGMSQEELALGCGLSTRTIRNLERSRTQRPYPDTVRRLADALGLRGEARSTFIDVGRGRFPGGGRAGTLEPSQQAWESAAGYRYGLPADTAAFTGREAELELIARTVIDDRGGGVVAICAIEGMPGVGKTALAVHAAHSVEAAFPGRHLFIDLHGHSAGREPLRPEDALALALAASGVDARFLPADVDGRAMLWRDRMSGERALLVFDNAASSAQVAPLLPGAGGCLVLVTSRRQLSDLPGLVLPLTLATLTPEQARVMFSRLAPRAASEDHALIDEIAGLAGYLPLAISLLVRVYARHPSWTLNELLAETRDSLLTLSAENVSVAAAFDVSWRHLEPSRQRLLSFLGLHPGTTTENLAAAALAGVPEAEAARLLDDLHREGLISETAYRRYGMHDLIRSYAISQARATLSTDEATTAVDRLLDYYTVTAAQAELAWLRTERANLLACLDLMTATRSRSRIVALTIAIAGLLRSDGLWARAVAAHTAAAEAARALGDRPGLARCLVNLGVVRRLSGDYPAATEALSAALDIYRDLADQPATADVLIELGYVQTLTGRPRAASETARKAMDIYDAADDQRGLARALILAGNAWRLNDEFQDATSALMKALEICLAIDDKASQADALRILGDVRQLSGDYQAAAAHLEHALKLYRDAGDQVGQANALTWLGKVRLLTGDYPVGIGDLEQALNIQDMVGNQLGQANALALLGDARLSTGDLQGATRDLDRALSLYHDIGSRSGEASVLSGLGNVRQAAHDYPAAERYVSEAVKLSRALGDRGGEATGLNNLGAVHYAHGDLPRAQACHQQALELARLIESSWDEGHALTGLGRCALAAGDTSGAASLLQQALEIFQNAGAAEAAEVTALLESIADGGP